MSGLRLYRKIYLLNHTPGNDVYSLIDPIYLSAATYNSNVIVENNLNVFQESTGVYYVDLNPDLYSNLFVYELRWTIQYISNSPYKILQTLFKYESNINRYYIFGEIDYESKPNFINYEIHEQKEIIIEIVKAN
jgi:hypothetical protein